MNEEAKKVAKELGLGDEVEIILYYQLSLKKALQLPISGEGMLYPGMAEAITDKMLLDGREAIKRHAPLDLLARCDTWREFLKKVNPKSFEEVDDWAVDQINELSLEMPSADFERFCRAIRAVKEDRMMAATSSATLERGLNLPRFR